ncbi:MAG: hypothetical protein L6R42_004624 [Xanthoria sp. 1 TBL-2021]|nr:MAG: hypothetical protein L6R42_004624 [Xanthoria sp. 1 TBL-2021]
MRSQLLNTTSYVFKCINSPWQCRSTRIAAHLYRNLSNGCPTEKPYYVTTPIFYVNADPHVGHLYTIVLTDVLKRFHALKGRKAILCTGTDEHGMKIQRAAEKAKQDVRAFCNENFSAFNRLATLANVQYDHFIRTSEPDHRFAVQHFWLMLKERGYIYESKHEGWYSVSDETFYPPSAVHLILDPATGRKLMASQETGKEVEWTSETNYHFRMSTLRDRLLEFYADNPQFVEPSSRMQDVVSQVTSGLSDLSISRPVERLSWGIPVPDDTSQTIYVWLDALINYLTKANYPFQVPGQEHAAGWPADVHVIGKDIVRFHCIYWPAFLLALDLPLPKQILTHAHWTLGHEKMSKSTGNVVNPFYALERFGSDTMRYYLVHSGGIQDDSDYDNQYIIERYKLLQGNLGNLVTRVVRGKGWNVRRAVASGQTDDSAEGKAHVEALKRLLTSVDHWMAKLHPGAAMKQVLAVVQQTNQYMQKASPWDLSARTDEHGVPKATTHLRVHQHVEKVDSIIYLCAESIRICGILLQTVMPQRMKHLLNLMGVDEGRRMFKDAVVGADREYGVPMVDIGKGREGVVFPPLDSDL